MKLKIGSRGPQVKDIQEKLLKQGYFLGSTGADGNFGELTEEAVIKFQKKNNLEATGIVDSETYRRLVYESFTPGDRLIYLHSPYLEGKDIFEIQKVLKSLGFNPGPVDGIYGPSTEKAVQEFQLSVGISPDGIIGPRTFQLLEEVSITFGSTSVVDYPARKKKESGSLFNKKIALDVLDKIGGGRELGIEKDIIRRTAELLGEFGADVLLGYQLSPNKDFLKRLNKICESGVDALVCFGIEEGKNKDFSTVKLYSYRKDFEQKSSKKDILNCMYNELVSVLRSEKVKKGDATEIFGEKHKLPVLLIALSIERSISGETHKALISDEWRQRLAIGTVRGLLEYFSD